MLESIIKDTDVYRDYPFSSIDKYWLNAINVASQFLSNPYRKKAAAVLVCLECFLEISNNNITEKDGFMSGLMIWQFIGALNSKKFIHNSNQVKYYSTSTFLKLLKQMKIQHNYIFIPDIKLSTTAPNIKLKKWSEHFEQIMLNEEKVWVWSSWYVISASEKKRCLPLYFIYQRLGREFTEKFYAVCENYYSVRKTATIVGLNELSRFIGQYEDDMTADKLQNEGFVTTFLNDFLLFFIQTGKENKMRLSTISRGWRNRFLPFYWNNLVTSGLFSKPIEYAPTVNVFQIKGENTRIRINKEGYEVKTKLMTHIPLHIDNDEAIEQIFIEISRDVNAIEKWAEIECKNIFDRRNNRLENSKKGKIREVQKIGTNSGEHSWINSRKNPEYLNNAAATFEKHGYITGNEITLTSLYPVSLSKLAIELGLPTANALLPHCALLVIEHPEITPHFLLDFKLYNKNNKLTGYIDSDDGKILVGYKYRKGAKLAEQKIKLTAKSTIIIEQIILLTEPVRCYLREHDDGNWRYLLLSTGQGFGVPKRYKQFSTRLASENKTLSNKLVQTDIINLSDATILAENFNLSTLRASVGVKRYLKNKEVKELAKDLGHEEYDPKLIAHYLPKLIYEFFQERDIRIVQNVIITLALEDSKHLLEASDFNSMYALDCFLKNHTSKFSNFYSQNKLSISKQEKNTKLEDSATMVYVGLDEKILTILLSLEKAVDNAKNTVSVKAKFWADFSKLTRHHIETELSSRPDIQQNLKFAQENCNSELFMDFVYEI